MNMNGKRPGDPWRSPHAKPRIARWVLEIVAEVRDAVEEHPRFCAGFLAGLLACGVAWVGVVVARALLLR